MLEAYQLLRKGRWFGMAGPQPLPLTEIGAALRLLRVPRRDRCDWATLLRAMDGAELKYLAEVRESCRPSTSPSTRAE